MQRAQAALPVQRLQHHRHRVLRLVLLEEGLVLVGWGDAVREKGVPGEGEIYLTRRSIWARTKWAAAIVKADKGGAKLDLSKVALRSKIRRKAASSSIDSAAHAALLQ